MTAASLTLYMDFQLNEISWNDLVVYRAPLTSHTSVNDGIITLRTVKVVEDRNRLVCD